MQIPKVTCPICGQVISKSNATKHQRRHEVHPETFKSGTYKLNHDGLECQFCGKTCKNRNSLCNHERLCKNNPNKQETPAGFLQHNKDIQNGVIDIWNKGLTSKTDERVAQQQASLNKFYKTHDGVWAGKTLPEYMKKNIGKGVKQFLIENPDMVPYKRNHPSKESYPEKYFTKLFQQEGIKLVKQFSVHSYHLDFCDPDKKIDIEIDGDQHYLDPKIVEHDKIRNKFLEDNGWTLFRIRWSDYKKMTDQEKEQIVQKIKELLN